MATVRTNHGETAERPLVIGTANGADPIFVEATGAYNGMRVHDRRYVTGTGVDEGVDIGILVEIQPDDGTPARRTAKKTAAKTTAKKTTAKKTAASR
jgi:hypothetical protein